MKTADGLRWKNIYLAIKQQRACDMMNVWVYTPSISAHKEYSIEQNWHINNKMINIDEHQLTIMK